MITIPSIVLFGIISIFILLMCVMISQVSLYIRNKKIFKQLLPIIASETNIILLEKKIIDMLVTQIGVSRGSFVLVSDFNARTIDSLDSKVTIADKFSPLEKMLHHVKNVKVYEKLTDPVDKQTFATLGISVIIPLIVEEEYIGLMVLGPKTNKKKYTTRDIKFFESLTPSVGVALKNAEAYRKIQEFSRTFETKLIDRTHELEEAQAVQLKLKDEFVFIATHDLATPVTAISWVTQMISARSENISDQLKKDLMIITDASDRLKVLVNDLLQVARSESGTVKIDLVDVDARKIIETAVQEVGPLAADKKINIAINLAPNNTIKADPNKLSEVFENILSNGVKYNKEGGSLSISSHPQDDGVVFEFKDTGLGIPEAEIAKVFTKFFRSEKPEARAHPGTGLGLFVVRMLTEKMGGKISFESIEDKGTTFSIFFKR